MNEVMVLIPDFVDRGGRTVYTVFEYAGLDNGGMQPIGKTRYDAEAGTFTVIERDESESDNA